jgi:hypothetical protein
LGRVGSGQGRGHDHAFVRIGNAHRRQQSRDDFAATIVQLGIRVDLVLEFGVFPRAAYASFDNGGEILPGQQSGRDLLDVIFTRPIETSRIQLELVLVNHKIGGLCVQLLPLPNRVRQRA